MSILQKMTGHQYRTGPKFDKAIIAVGSCENHGYHLPFGTDTFVSSMLAERVAEQVEGLLVLPPVNVGMSQHYAHFPFSLTLSPETLIAVLKDILESTVRNGIEKIFIMNGHDGNIAPIEIAARAIKLAHPRAKIATLDAWWVTAGKLLPKDTFAVWNGLGHAGEGETSIGLALFPELIQMEHAKGVVPNLPENIEIKWNFAELTNTGATGDPSKATAGKGQKMVRVLVDEVVRFIREMDGRNWQYASPESALPQG
ncbi:creatinine amidohydrolase [Hydrogenispora ethanolica]|uniref:Creatinine amidohydrolase n=1 Tax=Hydrogenispora ethanolica TaxID=1082276 RepID=A0A4R1SCS6_HYDET|nr:creatininase family protein [Hydrogenispora ethanolica]TCL76402.1 creatinine amidohydrolase [Hydrogenispora ethanolica]